jgi:hypothetical protein
MVLRQQLEVLNRQVARARFEPRDRLLLAAASRLVSRARWHSFSVRPETLLRWHRRLVTRKAARWGSKSRGRPPIFAGPQRPDRPLRQGKPSLGLQAVGCEKWGHVAELALYGSLPTGRPGGDPALNLFERVAACCPVACQNIGPPLCQKHGTTPGNPRPGRDRQVRRHQRRSSWRCRIGFREVSVVRVKEILRLWLQGHGLRPIARLTQADRKTVASLPYARIDWGAEAPR